MSGNRPAASPVTLRSGELLFGNTGAVRGGGMVATAPRGAPDSGRRTSALSCARAYFAGGTGLCLSMERTAKARLFGVVFDRGLRERRRFALPGIPSRTRVSASGRMAAWTVFVNGHSYAGKDMSTTTGIMDTRTGATVHSLEEFALTRNGRPLRAADLNYWGVTFAADDDRFYATVKTKGTTYLVEGSVSGRRMRTLRTNVECPSLSPDGRRVAYKKATGLAARPWRLHVLDLRTMRDEPLAEASNVDDQAAWLDARTVMYGRVDRATTNVWTVPADGSGPPRLLARNAFSPSVVS
ncbi:MULTISPECIES: hypothetical protein [Actinomadura]|uniref:TolB-like translocation protein n=1 Tax=Actinomadura yumaensis TaxID=111807 RepID=A0ABW2C9W0_9ACTN|nr:hypothetical protein [Actinomadura sp. J1-007]MWK33706.1 hypothetical protein [Actinomadura sp. J1-007]